MDQLPEFHRIRDAFDPLTRTPGSMEIRVKAAWLEALRFLNPWELFNSHTARVVVQDPEHVFSGVRTDAGGEPTGWCYAGRPETIKNAANSAGPLPGGMVFLAFVTYDGLLYHWGLETADTEDPSLPKGHSDGRFAGGITWSKN